ncbi:uncharacterized protein RCC_02167 [Ramularia collo-cygni]|uniref:Uncharacterized protein n=1 Tax=Ramularia collo-cygni TaxID=112498 RepID=A0A2D3URU3_9PEZI|nr:uncharacterized protein RCC_02167 [Ramularia collo-cygni]CZT16325.1 uncharacterized protein RCC_02167 [Ramularia collo-cygni]
MDTGNGDRRRSRSKTVSGPRPDTPDKDSINDDAQSSIPTDDDLVETTMKFPWSSPSAPATPTGTTSSPPKQHSGHKRSVSGNILAKLNFLRNASEDARPPSRGDRSKGQGKEAPTQTSPNSVKSRKSIDDDGAPSSPVSPGKGEKGESAMAAALKPSKTRKRKGSLRKAALLGGRKLMTEGRERKNSFLQRSPSLKSPVLQVFPISNAKVVGGSGSSGQLVFVPDDQDGDSASLRSKFSYENLQAASSTDSGWSSPSAAVSAARLSLVTEHREQQTLNNTPGGLNISNAGLASPVNLKSKPSYASTTDDDDILTFNARPATSSGGRQRGDSLKQTISSAPGSYFPPILVQNSSTDNLARRLSARKTSPLSHNIQLVTEPEPHDYTETEYWGWVILLVTWVTFAVGMGSCLDIWSWAWDVGETPYAPPELEDDPTLPIVGYYPALIVLTGVVAWVWITIAWLGMKYFRHARVDV